MNRIVKFMIIVFTIFMALFAPWIGSFVANQFNYDTVDADHAFAWVYVHHIVQALVILVLIFFIARFSKIHFGFTIGDQAKGITYVKRFALYFLIYNVCAMAFILLTNDFVTFPYPLNLRNVVGQLSFQLLLSGPSEEIIFRAFIMAILGFFIKTRILSSRFSIVNIMAAVVFVIAHISIQFNPFTLSYIPMQLVYSFILGMIYGDCYEKTRSIYYPMALHSISNVISVSAVVITQLIFG